MTARSIVLLEALPAWAQQDQFEAAKIATAAGCVGHLRPEQLPPCVLALQRQVLQLQAVVPDPQARLRALEEAVLLLSGAAAEDGRPGALPRLAAPNANPCCRAGDRSGAVPT